MNKYYENNIFDLQDFNKEFIKMQQNNIKQNINNNKINKKENKEYIYQLNMAEILNNTKDAIFAIIYDILTLNFKDIFTKDNRLFYLGLFLLIFSFIIYLLSFLFYNDQTPKINIKNNDNNKFKQLNNQISKLKNIIKKKSSNQQKNKINNEINNQLENPTNNEINNQLENPTNNELENQTDLNLDNI